MTIPVNVSSELRSLQDQLVAATPLSKASFPTIRALQLNAYQLVVDIQSAITQPNLLDTWTAPTDPVSMITGFQTVATAGNDQNTLSLMRGVVGRAASNLDQLV